MSEPQQHNLIGAVIAGKVVDVVIEKALQKIAAKPGTDLTKSDVPVVAKEVSKEVKTELQSRVDHVTDQEPFYKSRNVWGSFVGIITAFSAIITMWNDGVPNTFEEYSIPIGVLVAALTPLYSRYIAKKPIGE